MVIVRCISVALDVASNLGRMPVLCYTVHLLGLESPLEKLLMLIKSCRCSKKLINVHACSACVSTTYVT